MSRFRDENGNEISAAEYAAWLESHDREVPPFVAAQVETDRIEVPDDLFEEIEEEETE